MGGKRGWLGQRDTSSCWRPGLLPNLGRFRLLLAQGRWQCSMETKRTRLAWRKPVYGPRQALLTPIGLVKVLREVLKLGLSASSPLELLTASFAFTAAVGEVALLACVQVHRLMLLALCARSP